jgi:hypothetical protein
MEEAPENDNKSSHSALPYGMNERMGHPSIGIILYIIVKETVLTAL